jgi:hypothetical protein
MQEIPKGSRFKSGENVLGNPEEVFGSNDLNHTTILNNDGHKKYQMLI